MTPIKAIIFDLEGTIADTEPIWSATDNEFLGRRKRAYEEKRSKHLMMGLSVNGAMQILIDHYGLTGNADALVAERKQIFTTLLEREVKFIPGFEEFFDQVKHLKTAIGTSSELEPLKSMDHRLGLSKLFGPHIYSIAQIGYIAKPNPDIFLHAAKQLHIDPDYCLVIEDAPLGVQAAKAAGMRAIALTTSTTRERLAAANADAVVDSYAEIDLSKPNLVTPASFSS